MHASESEIDSPPKHTHNNNVRIVKSKVASKSKTVKGKEEKNLNKGVGTLEYEVMQTEKLQDNIDKYKQKIKDFTKQKAVEIK